MVDDQHTCTNGCRHMPDLFNHGDRFAVAHATGRFVEEHKRRRHRRSPCQFKATRVAVVQFTGPTVAVLPDARLGNQRVRVSQHPVAAMLLGDDGRNLHVLPHGERREQSKVLERSDQAGPSQTVGRQRGEVDAVDVKPAGGRRDHARDHVDQRGLACTVRADDANDLTARSGQPRVGQCVETAKADADVFGEQRGRRRFVQLGQSFRLGLGGAGQATHGPAIQLPIIEQTDRSPNHEAEHREAEENRLQVLSEDPVERRLVKTDAKDLETVLAESSGQFTTGGHHPNAEQRASHAVSPADDQHHQRQQRVVEEEVVRQDRAVLIHTKAGADADNDDRQQQRHHLLGERVDAHGPSGEVVLTGRYRQLAAAALRVETSCKDGNEQRNQDWHPTVERLADLE